MKIHIQICFVKFYGKKQTFIRQKYVNTFSKGYSYLLHFIVFILNTIFLQMVILELNSVFHKSDTMQIVNKFLERVGGTTRVIFNQGAGDMSVQPESLKNVCFC